MKNLKTTKKIYVFLVLLFAALILSGCGAAAEDNAKATETQTETVTETEKTLITVFGKQYEEDIAEIVLEKDEIPSFDLLLSSLKKFSNLSVIDLQDYELNMEEIRKLKDEFPDAEIKCRVYTVVSEKRIYEDDTEMDLTGVSAIDAAELKEALSSLPAVKRVFSDRSIPLDDKDALIAEFPDVSFEITGWYSLYGVIVPDNAEDTCLDGVQIELDKFAADIKRLPALKKIDLRGVELSAEDQAALMKEFPDIRFIWNVLILGEKYDSETEDLDLSGKSALTADIMRQAIPLMAGLKRVDMSDCASSYEELAALREEFPDVKIVWRLTMGKWSLKTDAVAFSVLIYHYDYKRLTSDDIQCLKYCTDLQALDLGHQSLTDLSVIGDYLTELRILILADNRISDLTPIAKLKHLHYIELFVNSPLRDISPIGECKELVDVNISHLNISDISNLFDLPLLERLWIEHTYVPAKDIQRLRETYPDAKIIVDGYGSVDQGWREHPRYFAMIDMYHKKDYISEEFSKYDQ